jgi:hypothetical protein
MKLSIAPNAIAVLLSIVMVSAVSPANATGQAGPDVRRSVVGVWMVTTTPRSCTTGSPIPGAEFEGLFTFHGGGTMSAWAQNAFITVTRSPSHGVWQPDDGRDKYSFAFVHLRYDLSGIFLGKQVAEGTLALDQGGDQFTTDSSTALFDTNGLSLGGGCASSAGTRFDLGS